MPTPRRTARVWGDVPNERPHIRRVDTGNPAARCLAEQAEPRARRRSRRIRASAHEAPIATPWVTLLCKYRDVAAEPVSPAHVQDMMGETYPRLGHYWRELSYGRISLAGSRTVGWVTLPGARAEYHDAEGNPHFARLLEHATTAAADQVQFADFFGINLVFNDGVGCCNWGARWHTTLQGTERAWGVTWLPPTAMRFLHDVAHEMGHGYGLPHARDDHWDVMSWGSCGLPSAIHHPVFGCVDVHTIAWHKDKLGWIPPERKHVHLKGSRTLVLERLAQPGPEGLLLVQIPIPGTETRCYTLEARTRVGYDEALPGNAVIIHDIDPTRDMPAALVQNPAHEHPMWLPGETFTDAAHGIRVSVLTATETGFVVRIRAGRDVPAALVSSRHRTMGSSPQPEGGMPA
jgi:hypothetical protein